MQVILCYDVIPFSSLDNKRKVELSMMQWWRGVRSYSSVSMVLSMTMAKSKFGVTLNQQRSKTAKKSGKDSRSHKWREKIRVLNLAGTCLLDPKGFRLWGLKGFRVSFGSKGFRVSLESEMFPCLSKRYLIFGGRLKQNEEALILNSHRQSTTYRHRSKSKPSAFPSNLH